MSESESESENENENCQKAKQSGECLKGTTESGWVVLLLIWGGVCGWLEVGGLFKALIIIVCEEEESWCLCWCGCVEVMRKNPATMARSMSNFQYNACSIIF